MIFSPEIKILFPRPFKKPIETTYTKALKKTNSQLYSLTQSVKMRSLLLPPASSPGVSAVALRPGFQQRLPTRHLPLFNPLGLRRSTISSYQSPSSLPVYGFQIRGSKPSFTVAFSSPTSPAPVSADNEVDKAKLAQVLFF